MSFTIPIITVNDKNVNETRTRKEKCVKVVIREFNILEKERN